MDKLHYLAAKRSFFLFTIVFEQLLKCSPLPSTVSQNLGSKDTLKIMYPQYKIPMTLCVRQGPSKKSMTYSNYPNLTGLAATSEGRA